VTPGLFHHQQAEGDHLAGLDGIQTADGVMEDLKSLLDHSCITGVRFPDHEADFMQLDRREECRRSRVRTTEVRGLRTYALD
jgi:hypothetical protein